MEKINECGFFEFQAELINFTGEKAAQLLNGQLTNDIKSLPKDKGNFNLLLNQKGKVRAAFYVMNLGNSFDLLLDEKDKSMVWEHFSKMAPLSKVMMSDVSKTYRFFHCCKADALEAASQLPLTQALSEYDFIFEGAFKEKNKVGTILLGNEQITWFRSDRTGLSGIDFFVPVAVVNGFIDWLTQKRFMKLDAEAIECIRIEQGIPKAGVDFSEDNLPQECGLDEALNFNKGCYLGQEIIARLHFKGHVNKLLKSLVISECLQPKVGLPLLFEGVEAGYLTSVSHSSKFKSYVALGYVPYKKSESNTQFQIEGGGVATIKKN